MTAGETAPKAVPTKKHWWDAGLCKLCEAPLICPSVDSETRRKLEAAEELLTAAREVAYVAEGDPIDNLRAAIAKFEAVR